MNGLRDLFRPSLPQLLRQAQATLAQRALVGRGPPPLLVRAAEEADAAFDERVCRAVQANKSGAPVLAVTFPNVNIAD